MNGKEALNRIDTKNYLTEREHKEFLNIIKKDLEVFNILINKDIELNLLKNSFKYEDGYICYIKIWCMNSERTYDPKKFITIEEYNLIKECFKHGRNI